MQDKQRTNISKGDWPRCREVILRDDGVLHCKLDFGRTYNFVKAYAYDPHVDFANARTDQQLINFARRWGPLFLNPETPGAMEFDFGRYRDAQRTYRALVGLLEAFKSAEEEREALLNFVDSEYKFRYLDLGQDDVLATARALKMVGVTDWQHEPEQFTMYWPLKQEFHIEGRIADWVRCVNLKTIRAATDYLIPSVLVVPSPQLVCKRSGQRRIEAGWDIYDLEAALRWMIWYDEFTQHPIICCKECRKVFRPADGRARTYCSEKCGHRVTARNAMRKRRGWTPEQIRAGRR